MFYLVYLVLKVHRSLVAQSYPKASLMRPSCAPRATLWGVEGPRIHRSSLILGGLRGNYGWKGWLLAFVAARFRPAFPATRGALWQARIDLRIVGLLAEAGVRGLLERP